MEQQVRLSKFYGDVFFVAEYMHDNDYIYARWYGVQSVETVKQGGQKLLDMLREKPCNKLLNSNKNVIGSWDMALDWVKSEWVPQAQALGLHYFAQVFPASYYATLTAGSLVQRINEDFEIRTFEDDAEAAVWLRSCR